MDLMTNGGLHIPYSEFRELQDGNTTLRTELAHVTKCNKDLTEENTYLLTKLAQTQERLAVAENILQKILNVAQGAVMPTG